MSLESKVLYFLLSFPVIIGIVGYIYESICNKGYLSPPWSHTTRNNPPNFNPKWTGIEVLNKDNNQINNIEIVNNNTVNIEDLETVEEDGDLLGAKEIDASSTEEFKLSPPTIDMEQGIKELIQAVASELPSFEAANRLIAKSKISPLGENYKYVAEMFGEKVADMVTATPDFALELGTPYVMIGQIQGVFLNCFGELIKIKGISKNQFDEEEYYLLKGQFISADLFWAESYNLARNIANGEDFIPLIMTSFS